MLPCGLLSAPNIFNTLVDGLVWYLQHLGLQDIFYYLDNFLIVGPPASAVCAEDLALLDQTCEWLGILAADEREGPTTRLTILRIEVDTVAGQLRLPSDKLEWLNSLLHECDDRKVCSQCNLDSLIGVLNHAAKDVRSSRTFLGHMWDLLHGVPFPPPPNPCQ